MHHAASPIDAPNASGKLVTIDTFVVDKSLLNAKYGVATVLKYRADSFW
jgi:hypothetical protein